MLPNDEDHVDDGDDNHYFYGYENAHYGDTSFHHLTLDTVLLVPI